MESWCIAIRLGSARLIQQYREVTQYGKGCASTTDASSNFMNILIGWNVRLGPFHSPKSRRAKKSSTKLTPARLKLRGGRARLSGPRPGPAGRPPLAWINAPTERADIDSAS